MTDKPPADLAARLRRRMDAIAFIDADAAFVTEREVRIALRALRNAILDIAETDAAPLVVNAPDRDGKWTAHEVVYRRVLDDDE